MVQRQWEEEYEIHMYSGGGRGEGMDFTQLIFKHQSFTVLKKTKCLMYGCFKDNAFALFIIVPIFI